MCINIMNDNLISDNSRKQYFRQYYLDNKLKYIKEKESRDVEIPVKKRGRPKKIIPPFKITTGVIIVSF